MNDNEQYDNGRRVPREKLTDWVNEPSVMALRDDLEMAKPAHDELVSKITRWLDLRNITGSARPPKAPNNSRSTVQPKLVRRQAEWRYSALSEPFLSSDKVFNVRPRTWEDAAAARQNELILEWQFNTKLDKVSFIDEMVRTAVDEGTCFVRVGWQRETEKELTTVPVLSYMETDDPAYLEQLIQVITLMQENPNGFSDLPIEMQEAARYSSENGIPVMARIVGEQETEIEKAIVNQPTLEILDYNNVYIDPTCNGDLSKARFVIVSFETSKAELIKDGRYRNLDKVNWDSSSPYHEPDHSTSTDDSQQFRDELRKRVVAYEYWGEHDINGDNKLVPIVATWIGNTMIRMEENPFPDRRPPIVAVRYLPVKKSVSGEPDAELLAENQAILGAVTRGMIDIMGRSANGQTGFAKGMLDVVNRRRYDNGFDYEFNPSIAPNIGIKEHTFPEIPNSALTMLQLQNQEAEALSGVKAFSGGLSGEAYGDVAAGIRGMLDASAKREMAIIRRLAKGMKEIGRKIMSMNQVFLSDEEVIRVTNDEFVTIRREDLAGEFDLIVDISTAEIDEARAQDLTFMLQTMGNSMDFSITKLILAKIARLKRMPDLAERIEAFQPQPDPIEEQKRQLEIQKLQLEIQELQSKAMLNQAKARKEAADADLKDLDFLEQETGTKHAREMAGRRAQAEANQDLEITKKILETDDDRPKEAAVAGAVAYKTLMQQLTDK